LSPDEENDANEFPTLCTRPGFAAATKVRANASKHKAMSYGRSNRHDLNSPSKTKTVYQRPTRWTHDQVGDRFMRGFSFSVNPAITANSSNMRVNPVCGISA
jgi:hypothetical protein